MPSIRTLQLVSARRSLIISVELLPVLSSPLPAELRTVSPLPVVPACFMSQVRTQTPTQAIAAILRWRSRMDHERHSTPRAWGCR